MKLVIEIETDLHSKSSGEEFEVHSWLCGSGKNAPANSEACWSNSNAQAIEVARLIELNGKIAKLIHDYSRSSNPRDLSICTKSSCEQAVK